MNKKCVNIFYFQMEHPSENECSQIGDIEDIGGNSWNAEDELEDKWGDQFLNVDEKENTHYTLPENSINRYTAAGEIVKPYGFDKLDLVKLREYVNYILDNNPQTKKEFNKLTNEARRKVKVVFKKTDLWYMYQVICKENSEEPENNVRCLLLSRPIRGDSGVMVYVVFTAPFWKAKNGVYKAFSCAYNCLYCPEQPGMPRSYVTGEPGSDRAHGNNYDVAKTVWTRATTYSANGHVNDKCEVQIKGGTWHSYPEEYTDDFIARLYWAFNTLHGGRDRPVGSYKEEIKINETAKARVIGLTIESRFDQVRNAASVIKMREYGITRFEGGLQHTNEAVLARTQRRCTTAQALEGIRLLKDAGFKLDGHLMVDLPQPHTKKFRLENKHRLNSKNLTCEKEDVDWEFDMYMADIAMFHDVFVVKKWFDQVKLYPFSTMAYTKFLEEFNAGLYTQYGTSDEKGKPGSDKIIKLLADTMANVIPPYVRINRVGRDIPTEYEYSGLSNMSVRQAAEKWMKKNGQVCNDIHNREIKSDDYDVDKVRLDVIEYESVGGTEYFIQYVTEDYKLLGFIRLRLSENAGKKVLKSGKTTTIIRELQGCALIRELHVYGNTQRVNRGNVNTDDSDKTQHRGYGSLLLDAAYEIARNNGYTKVSCISGVGVREYYRKRGFYDGDYYLLRDI